MIAKFVILFFLFTSFCCAHAQDYPSKVISIQDGDSLTVMHFGLPVRIRLARIDCPEKGQPFSERAKQRASELAFSKEVVVVQRSYDKKFGRVVADITLPEGKNMNEELVSAGLCWWYRHFDPADKKMEKLESAAREKKLGLWKEPTPVAPWDWRAVQKGRQS